MKMIETIAQMTLTADAMYAAINEEFGKRSTPVRSATGCLRAELRRLTEMANGRPADPTQGTRGENPVVGFADIEV